MSDDTPDIVILDRRIDPGVLRRLMERHFEDMVKFVVDVERWSRFSLDQQVLRIANEMHRATALQGAGDRASLERAYERVLRLVDLTVALPSRLAMRRELLRWRDLIAALFIGSDAAPANHRDAFRALLLLRPAAAKQIPLLLG